MKTTAGLVWLLVAALAGPAAAQVYRCDTPSGVVFSQTRCADDAAVVEVNTSRPSGGAAAPSGYSVQGGLRQMQSREAARPSGPSVYIMDSAPKPADLPAANLDLCRERHPGDYALQAGCRRNAERGLRELKGSYGMAAQAESAARAACLQRHPNDYALQAACMRNQARGYGQMTR